MLLHGVTDVFSCPQVFFFFFLYSDNHIQSLDLILGSLCVQLCVYVHTHGSFIMEHILSGSLSFTDTKIDQRVQPEMDDIHCCPK